MVNGMVALLGNLNIERLAFDKVATEFDWAVDQADDLASLREMSATRDVVAVLFDARRLGVSWHDALESVLTVAPRSLPIVCPGFSDVIRWPELADAGAFHELRLPVDHGEARRSLGFVWAAKRGLQPFGPAVATNHRDQSIQERSPPVISRAPRLYVK
jgi:DNA-binding NtrC family response regulator